MTKEGRFIICKRCRSRNDFTNDGKAPMACWKCQAVFDFVMKDRLATIQIYTTGDDSQIDSHMTLDPNMTTNGMRGLIGELHIIEAMIVHAIIDAERSEEHGSTKKPTEQRDDDDGGAGASTNGDTAKSS